MSLSRSSSKKGGTASARNFSYQSFSEKIANLKIDPIRRVRRHVDDEKKKESFFRPALESWIDMNLSTNFTQFTREVGPLTESLPHIIHYQDNIMDLLVKYIELRDVNSLQPLLDLLVQFARDLGELFENHFARAITMLSSIVVKDNDVSTIEWTFNCLAYLLKYLSRLLVPDLRPLFDTLSPLLGKEKQKPFVIRFAAEALSFLLRKSKDEPLRLLIRYAFDDLAAHPSRKEYEQGLSTMFLESCVSIDNTVHSKGPGVIRVLCEITTERNVATGSVVNVLQMVIVALIHHARSETFSEVQDVIYDAVEKLVCGESTKLEIAATLLYTVFTVRKGDRISDWTRGAELVLELLQDICKMKADSAAWTVIKAGTILLQTARMDVVIPKCSRIIEGVLNYQDGSLFLAFCEFAVELDSDRFQRLILRHFQRFVCDHWKSTESSLLLIVPKLSHNGYLRKVPDVVGVEDLPGNTAWVESIADSLTNLSKELIYEANSLMPARDTEQDLTIYWHRLNVLPSLLPRNKTTIPQQISTAFDNLVNALLIYCNTRGYQRPHIALFGKCLSVCSLIGIIPNDTPWEFLQNAFSITGDMMPFLQGAYDFISESERSPVKPTTEQIQIIDGLIKASRSPGRQVRKLSIQCLEILHRIQHGANSDAIHTALCIEETEPTLQSARNLSMYTRRLGASYSSISQSSWVWKFVPSYLFGLLTIQLSPVWDDVVFSLSKVAELNPELVSDIAFEWLEQDSPKEEVAEKEGAASTSLTHFQCSNLRNIEKHAQKCVADEQALDAKMHSSFDDALKFPRVPPHLMRAQPLKFFSEVPDLAQRHTRRLVPLFLEWSRNDIHEEQDTDESPTEDLHRSWSKKDRHALLTLFGKFTNPKVMYRSEDVYIALLHLLKSGDSKIQSLALKCIFTWNNPAIKTYAINLENLLDDTRFKDELTIFLQVDEEESVIQGQHRDDLMPVLLRVLYGRCLSRKNASSGTKGMESTRSIVLAALANFTEEERGQFIDIALGELANLNHIDKSNPAEYKFNQKPSDLNISIRKQIGTIKMAQDMLKQLGSKLYPFVPKIVDALLFCLLCSGQQIKEIKETDDERLHDEPTKSEGPEGQSTLRVIKSVRQGGLRVLNGLFAACPTFHWAPYLPGIFDRLINPRLELLPIETAQSPSGILQIFSTWASSRHTVLFLTKYDSNVISKIAECVASPSAKEEVVRFVFKILQSIVEITRNDEMDIVELSDTVRRDLIQPNLDLILSKIAEVLQRSPGKETLELGIETVSQLAPFVTVGLETTRLVSLTVFLLEQPTKRVSPRTKSDILRILQHFLPLCHMERGDELFEDTFQGISSLFGYFKDRQSRERLGAVFEVFSTRDNTLMEVAGLCQQLNSFSKRRIDEPDFEQRLAAYAAINEEKYQMFTVRQWIPLVYNMLYFIKDNEELAIRTNASYTLRRFAEIYEQMCASDQQDLYMNALAKILLPALRAGVREKAEAVKLEYVNVMSHLVKYCRTWDEVSDMQPLLVAGDEEANFFNNILHVQQHRRARALRRLANSAQVDGLSSSNIAHFFLPLIEDFVFYQEGAESHNLAAEAVITIGALVEQLTWPQFKALFKRYISYLKGKPGLEKTVVRLIGITVDSLAKAWVYSPQNSTEVEKAIDQDGDTSMEFARRNALAQELPTQDPLTREIEKSFVPTLSEFLQQKDENTVSLRAPVAVSIVKLLKLLPIQLLQQKLPAVLTDVCHILRSRAQESRDLTRKTLTDITALLGPVYFSFILKELRGALSRGYQLHVLSFTMHTILVTVAPTYKPGALDYCLSQMMEVIMDDIFGVTGMEKEAEGYISKMKEVKSSKSYDSAELLAQTATIPNLNKMIRPIQALLEQPVTLKAVKKIDELLRRIGLGLMKNEAVNSRDILVFSYQSIQEAYKAVNEIKIEKFIDEQTKRYLVDLKAPGKGSSATTRSSHAYKLIRFSLDNVRSVVTKFDNLMTPENLAGYISVIGDAVLSKHEEVRIAGLRLLTSIIRLQLPSIDKGVPVFVKQAVNFIKDSPSTNAEIAQASLKLMAAILRERQNVTIKETAIAYILTRIKPDLEEPDRQGITFNFLRAVLNRKIVIPEVYEILDNIAQIMVTNQSRAVRDMARGTYVQFFMEYPQGKERLKKQYAFLMKNLDYPHESGRASVLETINLLLTKVGDNLIQDVLVTFFIPLVMALVNDESPKCREMVGALIKKVMERADNDRITTFMNQARQWVAQDDNKTILRLGLQLYGLYFEVYETHGKKELPFLCERILQLLQSGISYDEDGDDDTETEPVVWELAYFSLQRWTQITQLFPATVFSEEMQPIWAAALRLLTYPHSWIRWASAKLAGLLFAEFGKGPLANVPLVTEKNLKLDAEDMISTARRCSAQLNSLELTEELALQVTKNLLFLGRCFYANSISIGYKQTPEEEVDDEITDEGDSGREVNSDKETKAKQKSALLWLMGRISWIIRSEKTGKLAYNASNIQKIILGKSSAIKWLAAMTQVLSSEDLLPLSTTMIMPLYNLVEGPETDLNKDLRTLASDALDMIRDKLGTTKYVQTYSKVKEIVQERRRERRHKRSIQMVIDPEAAAAKKMRKHGRKKAVRKEKVSEHRARRRGV